MRRERARACFVVICSRSLGLRQPLHLLCLPGNNALTPSPSSPLAHASTRSAGHNRPGGAAVVVPVESWSYSTRRAIVELACSAVEPLCLPLLSRVVMAAPLTRMLLGLFPCMNYHDIVEEARSFFRVPRVSHSSVPVVLARRSIVKEAPSAVSSPRGFLVHYGVHVGASIYSERRPQCCI